MSAEEKTTAAAPPFKVVVKLRGENIEPESLSYADKNGKRHDAQVNSGNSLARAVALILALYRRLSAPTLFRVSSKTKPAEKPNAAKSSIRTVRGANPIVLILNSHREISKAQFPIHCLGDKAQDNLLRLFRMAKGVAQPALELDVASCSPNEVCIEWDGNIITDSAKLKTLAATIAAKATPPWEIEDYTFEAHEAEAPEKSAPKQARSPTALTKHLAARWNARLLPCLIDSSYLQSAGRAISGAATSQTDIDNFLRFLGEVVAQRDVALVLATKGPVFKHSMEVVSQINKIGGRNVVRVIPGETIKYSEVAKKAASRIRANMRRWICDPSLEARLVDIAPNGGEIDLEIHEFLAHGAGGNRKWPLGSVGAKFLAHHILTHAGVVDELRPALLERKLPWTEGDTVRLCAAIRTECYFELAEMQGLSYQPSLARYAIASRNVTFHPILSIVGNRKLRAGKLSINLAGNERFLNALVTLGDFSPQTILGVAAELSGQISQLRDHLTDPSPDQKGDAWVVWQAERTDQIRKLYLRMTREHQAVGLDVVLGASDGTFVLGRPMAARELEQLQEIITPLAAPVIVAAEHLDTASAERWRQFTWNCGLQT